MEIGMKKSLKRIPVKKHSNLSTTAITKVMEAMVFTIDATKVGEVYLKLAKYMFRVKPTLQSFDQRQLTLLILLPNNQ
jgi:hypothetical protein